MNAIIKRINQKAVDSKYFDCVQEHFEKKKDLHMQRMCSLKYCSITIANWTQGSRDGKQVISWFIIRCACLSLKSCDMFVYGTSVSHVFFLLLHASEVYTQKGPSFFCLVGKKKYILALWAISCIHPANFPGSVVLLKSCWSVYVLLNMKLGEKHHWAQ